MAFTLQQLHDEIVNDPAALGYAPFVTAHDRIGVAGLLNAINQAITVKRVDVMAWEILEAIDTADVQTGASAPLPGALSWFESALQSARPLRLTNEDGSDTHILKNIKQIFLANGAAGANPQTRARLNAIALRAGSRAEQLWGTGTLINEQNVADAGIGN
jgi:hypothetical protein